MKEMYINGRYVRYETRADLLLVCAGDIEQARRHRRESRLAELQNKHRKVRQLHERPDIKCFAL